MRKLARQKTTSKKAEMKLKVNSKNATDARTAATVKNQGSGKNQRVDTMAFALEGLRARSGEQSRDLQGLSNVPSAETPSLWFQLLTQLTLKTSGRCKMIFKHVTRAKRMRLASISISTHAALEQMSVQF